MSEQCWNCKNGERRAGDYERSRIFCNVHQRCLFERDRCEYYQLDKLKEEGGGCDDI
ncbi:MAG: hypothetical protein LBL34_01430 [Clostridiales bacterium]|jgi:hypothetical protein|nr:hypothetical protein [Clostridiales bacterium]